MSKILTVDDDEASRVLVAAILSTMGHKVVSAKSGNEALGVIGSESLDLIVSDLEMGQMDGIELLRQCRALAGMTAIPFVLLTCTDDRDRMRVARDEGASGWIVKPVRRNAFMATIRGLLKSPP